MRKIKFFNKKIFIFSILIFTISCNLQYTFALETVVEKGTDNTPIELKKETQTVEETKATKKSNTTLKERFLQWKKTSKSHKSVDDANNLDPLFLQKDNIELALDDCINFALKNDPNVKIYKSRELAAKSRIGQAKSSYFPSLSGGTGYYLQNLGIGNRSVDNNYYQLNLSVNEMIWDFGKTQAKINMQKYNHEASIYDLDYMILNTIYSVKIAYYAVLAARANRYVYQKSVRINELNYERAKALYEEGLKSKIDVVNAEVYLTDAKIKLLSAENKYQLAIIALNNAMYLTDIPKYSVKNTENFNFQKDYIADNEVKIGYTQKFVENDDGEQSAILTSGIEKKNILSDFVFKPFDMPTDEAIKNAYENRPDLKSLILVEKASEESLKSIKRTFMPELGVSGGYSFKKSPNIDTGGFGVAAAVTLPNINIMKIKTQIDEANSLLDIAVNNVDLYKKNIYFEIHNYYANLFQLEKSIPLMGNKVNQTLENFELADGRYTVGLGNFIELQDAQTNYNNAQLSYVQYVFDYNVARAKLEKAMGVK